MPYASAAFAGLAAAVVIAFAYQAGFFAMFAPSETAKPVAAPAEQITVSQSTITGFDSQNRPYSITASSGVQDKDVPSRVHLRTVSGESQRSNGEAVTMKADAGLYDTEARALDLIGAVKIGSQGRFMAFMDKARVAVRERKLLSNSPVTVELPNGIINAKSLEITDDGNRILFFNGVRAHFRSSKGETSP